MSDENSDGWRSGRKSLINIELLSDSNPNSKDNHGMCRLHYACQHGWLDFVEKLVEEHKYDVNDKSSSRRLSGSAQSSTLNNSGNSKDQGALFFSNMTPLHFACRHGHYEIAKLLIEKYKCDLHISNSAQMTPLHLACKNNKPQVAMLLIQADDMNSYHLNIKDRWGNTPICYACKNNQLNVMKELIMHGTNVNMTYSNGDTILHIACKTHTDDKAKIATVKYLLKAKCDPNTKNESGLTPLQVTSPSKFDILEELITHHANPNVIDEDGNTLLHKACEAGCLNSVKLFLSHCIKCDLNTNLNKSGLTPLLVTPPKNLEILRELIECGANPNATDNDGNTLLHKTCAVGSWGSVRYLLSVKCDPNAKNKSGLTPLQVASPTEDNIIQGLITHGANPNVSDSEGNTPLHKACQETGSNCLSSTKKLLSASCDPDAKNKSGLTPLQVTPLWEPDKIQELIAHGANPNAIDKDGNTLLHKACKTGCQEWQYDDILISVQHLLNAANCNPNAKNNSGLTPLQITTPSETRLIQKLTKYHADPNVTDSKGNTPLHIAFQAGNSASANHLLKAAGCNPNITNKSGLTPLQIAATLPELSNKLELKIYKDGNTLLHKACQTGSRRLVRYLLKANCNPNAKNKGGKTPLQSMLSISQNAKNGDGLTPLQLTSQEKVSIMHILTKHGANPDVANNDGNTLLHEACQSGDLELTKNLLNVKCDPNAKNNAGLTPLLVTDPKESDIIKELIAHNANPKVTDCKRNTPLHEACKTGSLKSVKHLLLAKCDPLAKNEAGLIPLQVTSPLRTEIIQELLLKNDSSCNMTDHDGNTPLHIACLQGIYKTVQILLNISECDPNIKNKSGLTPLQLTAVPLKKPNILQELIRHGANPNVVDSDGNTPLHIFCKESKYETVKFLLDNSECDLNLKNELRETPVQVTSDLTIIKELIRHGAHTDDIYRTYGKTLKQPLKPPVKVFVVGNPAAGKSTLIAALKKEKTFLRRAFTPVQKITGVDANTAGVVPHDFESKEYGHAILFDFAGQKEFYGSHAAFLENFIRTSPPVFFIVVDLCESKEEILKTILFWLTFLENQCASVKGKPHVIIVGSHADVLKSRGDEPKLTTDFLKTGAISKFKNNFELIDFIVMNCQHTDSPGMDKLRHCLKSSCSILRLGEPIISFNAHCFFVYLIDKFKDSKNAVTLEQIRTNVTSESSQDIDAMEFIPDNLHHLRKICDELQNRGHILFLKDPERIEQSWIVIDKKSLLGQVSGSVFAPDSFKHDKACSQFTCSTGVVPLSSIAKHFPDHNKELLIRFFSCLEFCHEIFDVEILHYINAEHTQVTECNARERYFLFPALISLNFPENTWENKPECIHHCGWILRCSTERLEQFFTSRFLEVLLLRLAFTFPLSEGHSVQSHPAIQRNCSIWKNGIFWASEFGVETLVEVQSDNKAVIVLMRCSETGLTEFIKLRSQVICKVLAAAKEFCCRIDTVESFIDPSATAQYAPRLVHAPQLKLFSMLSISNAVCERQKAIHAVSPTGSIQLEKILQYEIYAGIGRDILSEIFERKGQDTDSQRVSDSFLFRFAEAKAEDNLFVKLFDPNYKAISYRSGQVDHTLNVLKHWRAGCAGTYKCLREKLDEFSVFAGRNHLLQACLAKKQEKSQPIIGQSILSHNQRKEQHILNGDTVPFIGNKPTLEQLVILEGHRRRVKVIESVAARWENLALALGFEAPVIDYLRRDFEHNSLGAATQVLIKWLNGEGDLDKPITWSTLIQCLNEAGKKVLAEDVEETLKDKRIELPNTY